jgi:lipoprotein-anchoring transpeptidase ErfK/SrfK
MSSTNHWRLAVPALAATILSAASVSAQPLAWNDPSFPFGRSIFQEVVREPAPQAYSAPADESLADEPAAAVDPRFRRQIVAYSGHEAPGTIIIDTPNTYLYYVLGQGRAIRYGIGVGRDGFRWSGVQNVSRKQEWPDWHPPAAMIARQPYLPRMVAGGPGNPLGARAMYLGSSEYRIHGTNAPETIGQRVSSGCIRLTNEDVEDLYNRVTIGAKVVVLPDHGSRAQIEAPAPARVQYAAPVRQRVSATSDAPRPPIALSPAARDSLAYGSSASRLY